MQTILVFWVIKTLCSFLHIQAIKYHHSLLGSSIETNILKELLTAVLHLSPVPLIVAVIGAIVFNYLIKSKTEDSL